MSKRIYLSHSTPPPPHLVVAKERPPQRLRGRRRVEFAAEGDVRCRRDRSGHRNGLNRSVDARPRGIEGRAEGRDFLVG
jgi:hypothetical protein